MNDDKFKFDESDDIVIKMVNDNYLEQKRIRENSIYNNNENNKKNNIVGHKKKKKVSIKTIALASIVMGLVINSAVVGISKRNAAINHVQNSFDKVDLPYHYVTSYNGDYFYDNGNIIELSDGVKTIVNDLTKQGASLEDIYYYLDINYGDLAVNAYKNELKKNNQELYLDEYKDMLYNQSKYIEDKNVYEGKAK